MDIALIKTAYDRYRKSLGEEFEHEFPDWDNLDPSVKGLYLGNAEETLREGLIPGSKFSQCVLDAHAARRAGLEDVAGDGALTPGAVRPSQIAPPPAPPEDKTDTDAPNTADPSPLPTDEPSIEPATAPKKAVKAKKEKK